MNWPNIIRAISILGLIVIGSLDFGLNVLAKQIPKEVYWGLLAIAFGVDISAIRKFLLRLLSGGNVKGDDDE